MNTDSEFLCFPPYHDELMTSWIARNALTFGIKPSKLSYLCFDNTDQWKSDIDAFLPPQQIVRLSDKTGISEDLIYRTTFNGSCDHFYSSTGKTAQVKWVMPLGVRIHKTPHYGLQFCPCCLIEDGDKPYFRKYWRLAFMTCCPHHSVQLHDRCPNCSSPIDIKRIKKSVGNKLIFHPEDIVKCSKCGFDLRLSNYIIPGQEELKMNLVHFSMYQNGYGTVGNQEFNYSNLYFEGARRLISFLLRKKKGRDLTNYILEEFDCKTLLVRPNNIPRQSEPETVEITHRRKVITCLYFLMRDWPEVFVSTCKEFNIFKQDLFSAWIDYPYWLHKDITFLVKRKWMPYSDDEREACRRFLEVKLKRHIQDYEITRQLTSLCKRKHPVMKE